MTKHQLRFISGKYQGGSYALAEGDEVVMGRGMDAGLTLFEEMVSRHHARFKADGGVVIVEDLGSKNGTFVNGERVEQRPLAVGDRILLGTSILRLEEQADEGVAAAPAGEFVADLEPEEAEAVAGKETMLPTVSAMDELEFDESSLTSVTATAMAAVALSAEESPDLGPALEPDEELEFDTSGLDLDEVSEGEAAAPEPLDDADAEAEAEVSEEDRQEVADSTAEPALLEDDELDPFAEDDAGAVVAELTAPGDTAVAGHPVLDEDAYRARWGGAPQSIYLAHPMQPSLEFLSPEQLSALQAAHNHGHLDGVAEALRKDDAWVKKTITFLLRSGYLDGT